MNDINSLVEVHFRRLVGQTAQRSRHRVWGRLWLSVNPQAVESSTECLVVGRTDTITTAIVERTN